MYSATRSTRVPFWHAQQDRELVAADPVQRIVAPAQVLAQGACDQAQHAVAGRMAVLVVEAPEVVEVDQAQGQRDAVAAPAVPPARRRPPRSAAGCRPPDCGSVTDSSDSLRVGLARATRCAGRSGPRGPRPARHGSAPGPAAVRPAPSSSRRPGRRPAAAHGRPGRTRAPRRARASRRRPASPGPAAPGRWPAAGWPRPGSAPGASRRARDAGPGSAPQRGSQGPWPPAAPWPPLASPSAPAALPGRWRRTPTAGCGAARPVRVRGSRTSRRRTGRRHRRRPPTPATATAACPGTAANPTGRAGAGDAQHIEGEAAEQGPPRRQEQQPVMARDRQQHAQAQAVERGRGPGNRQGSASAGTQGRCVDVGPGAGGLSPGRRARRRAAT